MSDNIDILTAIDVSDLPALSQDKNNPTGGLNDYIYMIVKNANAVSGQAGAELNISANIGDNVRWRETSLSSNFEYSVFFYNFVAGAGADLLSVPQLLGGVQNGTAHTINEELPIQGNMPWSAQQVATPYHYYQSTVESTGSVTYHWEFQVNRTSDGSLVGYGTWDPFITISN